MIKPRRNYHDFDASELELIRNKIDNLGITKNDIKDAIRWGRGLKDFKPRDGQKTARRR